LKEREIEKKKKPKKRDGKGQIIKTRQVKLLEGQKKFRAFLCFLKNNYPLRFV